MTTCTATLTTATVTYCDETFHTENVDGRYCDGADHVELHTMTCTGCDGSGVSHQDDITYWTDDTPGATPHTPTSTVTDAEVEAALDVLVRNGQPVYNSTVVSLREALEAAAAVRAAREGGR